MPVPTIIDQTNLIAFIKLCMKGICSVVPCIVASSLVYHLVVKNGSSLKKELL
jgi:hypothetical protein